MRPLLRDHSESISDWAFELERVSVGNGREVLVVRVYWDANAAGETRVARMEGNRNEETTNPEYIKKFISEISRAHCRLGEEINSSHVVRYILTYGQPADNARLVFRTSMTVPNVLF